MRVFITGATGFIGFELAQRFRRAGHAVWGLARSIQKATVLRQNEIKPVIGDMGNPESYRGIAAECSLLIHAAAEYTERAVELDRKTVQTLIDAGQGALQIKTFIYTSGCWVYGNTGMAPVDESAPLRPPALAAARPETERMVLGAKGIRSIVIRPGCVYGKQGSLTASWFQAAYERRALEVIGSGDNRWSMVHIDDVAEGYRLAAEKGASGEIFNLSDGSSTPVREMVAAIGEAAKIPGPVQSIPLEAATQKLGPLAQCLALNQVIDSSKAESKLGWHPRHHGFVRGVDQYCDAWKAFRG
jgi:nucleoside-diphosphate-sugar epimerase